MSLCLPEIFGLPHMFIIFKQPERLSCQGLQQCYIDWKGGTKYVPHDTAEVNKRVVLIINNLQQNICIDNS